MPHTDEDWFSLHPIVEDWATLPVLNIAAMVIPAPGQAHSPPPSFSLKAAFSTYILRKRLKFRPSCFAALPYTHPVHSDPVACQCSQTSRGPMSFPWMSGWSRCAMHPWSLMPDHRTLLQKNKFHLHGGFVHPARHVLLKALQDFQDAVMDLET